MPACVLYVGCGACFCVVCGLWCLLVCCMWAVWCLLSSLCCNACLYFVRWPRAPWLTLHGTWGGYPRERQGKKVHEFGTAVQGCGAIIFSPDLQQVLLKFDHKCWMPIGGVVMRGETCEEAINRALGGFDKCVKMDSA